MRPQSFYPHLLLSPSPRTLGTKETSNTELGTALLALFNDPLPRSTFPMASCTAAVAQTFIPSCYAEVVGSRESDINREAGSRHALPSPLFSPSSTSSVLRPPFEVLSPMPPLTPPPPPPPPPIPNAKVLPVSLSSPLPLLSPCSFHSLHLPFPPSPPPPQPLTISNLSSFFPCPSSASAISRDLLQLLHNDLYIHYFCHLDFNSFSSFSPHFLQSLFLYHFVISFFSHCTT
ncbi:hypothetical protein E2C01_075341 [Portunus trituberculatus]|uniref:Uncharacterized protein n=1 Tax=Portunus trituberculatus TaxID=210409 RepID=A0A5B7IER2_PORTR|nr:hypothetical protein [Portunus trituberculatus]